MSLNGRSQVSNPGIHLDETNRALGNFENARMLDGVQSRFRKGKVGSWVGMV